jgi:hypothetical protein
MQQGPATFQLFVCACLQSDARELASFTPSFLWLLRDFYLRLEDEQGRQVCATGRWPNRIKYWHNHQIALSNDASCCTVWHLLDSAHSLPGR